jgi:hypothetical protein
MGLGSVDNPRFFFSSSSTQNAAGRYLGGDAPIGDCAVDSRFWQASAPRALGRQQVGKTLAFHDVERARRGKKIEAMIVQIAGDNSRGAAANRNNIGVGHENFL